MKKWNLIPALTLMLFAVFSFSCCDATEKRIPFSQLPQLSQDFISTHFGKEKVKYAEKDKDGFEVKMTTFQVDFELNGLWRKVESEKNNPIPKSIMLLLPAKVNTYINQTYPDKTIVEVEIKTYGYKIEFGGMRDFELMFDKEGNFIGKDK